jgi:hypothetical protein
LSGKPPRRPPKAHAANDAGHETARIEISFDWWVDTKTREFCIEFMGEIDRSPIEPEDLEFYLENYPNR